MIRKQYIYLIIYQQWPLNTNQVNSHNLNIDSNNIESIINNNNPKQNTKLRNNLTTKKKNILNPKGEITNGSDRR